MKINLKQKKLKNGKSSLFLEFYNGYRIDKNGVKKHLRKFEYLKQYVFDNPKNAEEKRENKETLQLAENILAIRKAEYIQGKYKIKNDKKGEVTFLDYYEQLKEDRFETKANYGNWDAALKHIEKYCPPHKQLKDIDTDFVKGFKRYLNTKAKTKSGTPLSQNSKYTYFNKFKAALREAHTENYLEENVLRSVKGFEQGESTREYLTYSELQSLTQAECKYPVLKNAFIFSCLTGLRWSDIDKLRWSEVRDEDTGSRIIFRQKKTDGLEYLYVSAQSRALLGKRTNESDRVFRGLKYGAVYNTEILRWCMKAGITKHITFHSARHTNAVLLLENGADIYTVSKRLGHREIRTTEIYTKIIDEKMREAANLIPEFNLDI
ncbi:MULTISPECIES: tyrosine-type recombinase/integrase [Arenibacter]|uniref:tyrosine-type recombinase/integrase n=1 Tax=Arenibacter TaxID=178469 RepID=UPI0004DF2E8C|nr:MULTISPECIES: site-specific integrase [Arenibacter]GBF21131.1 tyrosine recombinase XerD [Arenibacter sp. NBRC 103722]